MTRGHHLPTFLTHRGLNLSITALTFCVTALAWVLMGAALSASQTISIGPVVPNLDAGAAAYVLTLVVLMQFAALAVGWKEYRLTDPNLAANGTDPIDAARTVAQTLPPMAPVWPKTVVAPRSSATFSSVDSVPSIGEDDKKDATEFVNVQVDDVHRNAPV